MDRNRAEPAVHSFPGPLSERWVAYHHEHAAPSTYVYDFVWDRTADATGPFVTDVDGNVFMDFATHVASAPLGYNNPKLLDRLGEFDLVDPLKIAGQDFYVAGGRTDPGEADIPGPSRLMELLAERSSQYGFDRVFLSNSGAEAVENAIKIAYDYRDGAKWAITFDGAFHGRTLGALSLNRSKSVHRRKYPEIAGVHDVPFCRDSSCTEETCSCGFFPSAGDPSELRRRLDPATGTIHPDDVAYIILEPIQGEGGYHVPSEEFTGELASLASEYDIPVIADEVQSGLGRTGEFWAVDHQPIEPDVIASGKGLRVGATISRSEVFPEERARLSSTWGGGDILSSALGVFTIEVIEEENLMRNATERGRQLLDRLEADVPDHVVDVRGLGLMGAIELQTRAMRDAAIEALLQRGLMTLGCGTKTLRFLPPLDVTEREIDLAVDIVLDALDDPAVHGGEATIDGPEDVL
ncbi:MAG: aspartate aminotransferase family protein [Halodesulfurarchaeum sp.]